MPMGVFEIRHLHNAPSNNVLRMLQRLCSLDRALSGAHGAARAMCGRAVRERTARPVLVAELFSSRRRTPLRS
jgi:hypothetical protein